MSEKKRAHKTLEPYVTKGRYYEIIAETVDHFLVKDDSWSSPHWINKNIFALDLTEENFLLNFPNYKKKWTEEEKKLLRKQWSKVTPCFESLRYLAYLHGRTIFAIHMALQKMQNLNPPYNETELFMVFKTEKQKESILSKISEEAIKNGLIPWLELEHILTKNEMKSLSKFMDGQTGMLHPVFGSCIYKGDFERWLNNDWRMVD